MFINARTSRAPVSAVNVASPPAAPCSMGTGLVVGTWPTDDSIDKDAFDHDVMDADGARSVRAVRYLRVVKCV